MGEFLFLFVLVRFISWNGLKDEIIFLVIGVFCILKKVFYFKVSCDNFKFVYFLRLKYLF